MDIDIKNCVKIGVEITPNARNLATFTHPERGLYIFGPEDGSIDSTTLSWCDHIVYIPTRYCMNLAATVNVVLYDRAVKLGFI